MVIHQNCKLNFNYCPKGPHSGMGGQSRQPKNYRMVCVHVRVHLYQELLSYRRENITYRDQWGRQLNQICSSLTADLAISAILCHANICTSAWTTAVQHSRSDCRHASATKNAKSGTSTGLSGKEKLMCHVT